MSTPPLLFDQPGNRRIYFADVKQVLYWTTRFACSDLELRQAACHVGPYPEAIETFLRTSRSAA